MHQYVRADHTNFSKLYNFSLFLMVPYSIYRFKSLSTKIISCLSNNFNLVYVNIKS